jgi:hypothetical protein
MPSHLTSVVAEQILAQACENENQNAKRLRLGLDPISQPLPPPNTNEGLANSPTTLNSQPTEAVHSPQSSTATTPTSTTAASPGQITNLFRPAFGPYQRSNSSTNAQPVPINQGKNSQHHFVKLDNIDATYGKLTFKACWFFMCYSNLDYLKRYERI